MTTGGKLTLLTSAFSFSRKPEMLSMSRCDGYHFLADEYAITPLASLQAKFVGLNAYTERAATDLNLKISAQNYGFLESGLGISVARSFSFSVATSLHPRRNRQKRRQRSI